MDRILSALVLVSTVLVGCGAPPPAPSAPGLDLRALLPDAAALAGWSVVEGPGEYLPENLYEVLDGGAERYVGYGFVRLLRVRYQGERQGSASVTLDLFDMGSELGAFGMYSSVRPLEGDYERWGVEGYRSGPIMAAWKGRLFVHVEVDEENLGLLGLATRLVRQACERVADGATPPAILAALPREGLVEHSERFIAVDLLGHECLPGGVVATYTGEGGGGELFFSDLRSEAKAVAALGELRAHHARRGATLGAAPSIGGGGFSFRDSRGGAGTVVTSGRFVAGALGTMFPRVQERLLTELVGRLPVK
jgi:hypothetical protein